MRAPCVSPGRAGTSLGVALTLEDGGTPPRPTCMCDRRATCCVLVHLPARPPVVGVLAGRLATGVRTGYPRPLFMQRDRRGVTPRRRELKRDERKVQNSAPGWLTLQQREAAREGQIRPRAARPAGACQIGGRKALVTGRGWPALCSTASHPPPCEVMAQPPRSLRWAKSAHGQWPYSSPAALGCFLWRLSWATPLQHPGDETSCFIHQSHDVESSRRSLR